MTIAFKEMLRRKWVRYRGVRRKIDELSTVYRTPSRLGDVYKPTTVSIDCGLVQLVAWADNGACMTRPYEPAGDSENRFVRRIILMAQSRSWGLSGPGNRVG